MGPQIKPDAVQFHGLAQPAYVILFFGNYNFSAAPGKQISRCKACYPATHNQRHFIGLFLVFFHPHLFFRPLYLLLPRLVIFFKQRLDSLILLFPV